MQLIRGINNAPSFERGSVATIGAFDGVHLGHQALFHAVVEKSKALQLPSVVICFEPLPREYFSQQNSPSRVMNFREKYEAMSALGIDYILRIRFDERLRNMTALGFVEAVFVNCLHTKHITIGDDFRFGHDREGGQRLLSRVSKRFGFELADTLSIESGGTRVSSSEIRKSLEQGDFEASERMLGRPYSMSGKVVYGRQLGRTLGFPTANIQVKRHKSPMAGVYIARIRLANGDTHNAVANVGTRPTLDDGGIKAVLEVHVLNFNGHLYGQRVEVTFLKKLRDERKFDSIDVLQKAIHADAEQATIWFKQAASA